MSVISMKQLLEAGVHFGHQTRSWNPKMKPYIFAARNGIHILNLEATEKLVDNAYNYIKNIASTGKAILFVGTKKQAAKTVEEEAIRSNSFFVNSRWLGGTLTNFKTIRSRIDRLNKIYNMEKLGDFNLLPKKEVAKLVQERDKLEKNLGGVKEMKEMPGALFVVDPKNEHIAVAEAKKLHIPVVAICDTNCDPDLVDCVIAANDDAISSVKLIVAAMADAIIEAREGVSMVKEAIASEPVLTTVTMADFIAEPVKKAEAETEKKAEVKTDEKKPAVKTEAKKPAAKTEEKTEAKKPAAKTEEKTEAKKPAAKADEKKATTKK